MASDLVLHCLPMSHKKDARLIWVKEVLKFWAQISPCADMTRVDTRYMYNMYTHSSNIFYRQFAFRNISQFTNWVELQGPWVPRLATSSSIRHAVVSGWHNVYDQVMAQSQPTDQPMALRGRNSEHKQPRDSKNIINPVEPNGISHYYQLDQSISILRIVE